MPVIARNLDQAAQEDFDVVIVGGGIYGAMLMLESVKAGLKPLLLEKADFGGGTSFNNLRIVHGGLRYLQTMHLSRINESVAERRWFLRTFPEFVRPLKCIMPLYGGLMKNRLMLSIALRMNDWLSRHRNRALPDAQQIPNGYVISANETRELFPQVRSKGLKGAAVWYDAVVPDCHRVQIEILRWATAAGGTAINYAEVTSLLETDGRTGGVSVLDRTTNREYEFRSTIVINAAGPDSRALSAKLDVERAELFHPSLAWNLLLNRPPLSDGAVAIAAPAPNARVYFSHSLGGRLLVGTGHAAVGHGDSLQLDRSRIEHMLEEVNQAVPGLELKTDEIVRIFSGQLPAAKAGTDILSDTPVILDHRQKGGPRGLFSVSGVKYTTSRSAAEAAIAGIVSALQPQGTLAGRPLPQRPANNAYELHPATCPDPSEWIRRARVLIETEAPQSLEDLLIRRSNLAFDPDAALAVAEDGCHAFGWDPEKSASQIDKLKSSLQDAAGNSSTRT